MRVALEVWSARYDELRSTCLRAEALGFDAFYYGESPNDLNLDCWTTLGALAASTDRIRLGPVIANVLPTYRSTILLAKQAATVATVSGGRLDCRTGVGASVRFARPWWEPFGVHYPDYHQRLADLTDALDRLPSLWSGAPPIPLTLAARGRRAMELVARTADVWETSFCTPREFRDQRQVLEGLVQERELVCSLEIDGFVASTGPGVDRLVRRVQQDRANHEDLAPVFERGLIGTPEDAAGRLVELVEAGVDQVVVALHDPHDRDALEALAEATRVARQTLDDRSA